MILSFWLVVKGGLIMNKDLSFMRISTILFFFIVLEIFCDVSWAEPMQNCKKIEADTLLKVATQKYGKIEPKDALKIFQEVLIIRRDLKDVKGESIALSYIGSIYKNLNDFPNAIIYFQKALEISRELGDKDSEESILLNISEVNTLEKSRKYIFTPIGEPEPSTTMGGGRR
jgi:tetratricopeptide (TPR) repeat protein